MSQYFSDESLEDQVKELKEHISDLQDQLIEIQYKYIHLLEKVQKDSKGILVY